MNLKRSIPDAGKWRCDECQAVEGVMPIDQLYPVLITRDMR